MTLWMILIMLIGFWLVSRFANKQQQKMLEEQKRRTDEALVVGNWVKTRAGFYGTVVEIDGDVVTLATPLGDESLWARSAIVDAEEPPFATESDDSGEDAVTEAADAPDGSSAAESGPREGGESGDETDETDETDEKGVEAADAEEGPRTGASQA